MKITGITPQQRDKSRYSIFVDGAYAFSLGESALLQSKIVKGQELTGKEVAQFKRLSSEDKIYGQTLRYVAIRQRSVWEIQTYLKRKGYPTPLIEQITNKLLKLDLLNDKRFAEQFVHDRRLLRSSSTRKIKLELQKKGIASDVIDQALAEDVTDEQVMLRAIIAKKRSLSKYQDDELKLMQYLARQGFSYGDIKDALKES